MSKYYFGNPINHTTTCINALRAIHAERAAEYRRLRHLHQHPVHASNSMDRINALGDLAHAVANSHCLGEITQTIKTLIYDEWGWEKKDLSHSYLGTMLKWLFKFEYDEQLEFEEYFEL